MRYENSPTVEELIKEEGLKLIAEITAVIKDPALSQRKPSDTATIYLNYFLPRLQRMIKFDEQAEFKTKIVDLCVISLKFIKGITNPDDWEEEATFMAFFENALLPYDLGQYEKIILHLAEEIIDSAD